jgi:hypothetical protein
MARIHTVNLDAVLKEEPVYKVAVTRHPVERGAQITDHAHPELVALNVEAIVSALDGDPAAAHQFFKSIHGKPIPIVVDLPRDVYPLMVLEEYAPIFEWQTGDALHFRAKFVEWRVANTKLAAVKKTAAQVKKGPVAIETIDPFTDQSKLSKTISGAAVRNPTAAEIKAGEKFFGPDPQGKPQQSPSLFGSGGPFAGRTTSPPGVR